MGKITLVIFDLGNTLIYRSTEATIPLPQAVKELTGKLIQLGYNLQRESFAQELLQRIYIYHQERDTDLMEDTTFSLVEGLLLDLGFTNTPQEHIHAGLHAYYTYTQQFWTPEEDAVSTLQTLQVRGYRSAMITNAAYGWDVQQLIDKAKIRPFLSHIAISGDLGIRKPHPQIFEETLTACSTAPQQAVMIGDTIRADILGANRFGMKSIWISRRADTPESRLLAKQIKPDAEVQKLTEIPDLLDSWNNNLML